VRRKGNKKAPKNHGTTFEEDQNNEREGGRGENGKNKNKLACPAKSKKYNFKLEPNNVSLISRTFRSIPIVD